MALRAVPDHPKFAHLKSLLKLPKAVVLGYLECIWHFTGRFTPQGNIGKYSDLAIEGWVEWDGEEGKLIDYLVKSGWLDIDDTYRLIVHDWDKHADRATRQTLARTKLPFVVPDDEATSPSRKHAEVETELMSNTCVTHEDHMSGTQVTLPVPVPVPGAGAVPVRKAVAPCAREAREEPTPPEDGIIEEIVCAHPKSVARNLKPNEVRQADAVAVIEAIEAECALTGATLGEAAVALREIMRGFVEKIPRGEWRYLKDPAEFFRCRDYRRDVSEFTKNAGGERESKNERIKRKALEELDRQPAYGDGGSTAGCAP